MRMGKGNGRWRKGETEETALEGKKNSKKGMRGGEERSKKRGSRKKREVRKTKRSGSDNGR